ncbi:conserved hypothetical protein [Altererythrobacter sp. B11]|uniref:hypothetical protein n=1 Tax=Altererythrobacter sp. B11 TaxID=2060312 RepID=UPI000DC7033A|nr:hypothetical protein [Altererythrobacter sp. B11]BBC70941.1 conserved hypothetical protein [Altererythrobacter sp. B11]
MDIFHAYHDLLSDFADSVGASHSILHVHAGLAIYVLVQYALRTRRASIRALKVVIAVAVAHELFDYLGDPAWTGRDALDDILLTISWPAVLTGLGLHRRARWERRLREQQALAKLSGYTGERRPG